MRKVKNARLAPVTAMKLNVNFILKGERSHKKERKRNWLGAFLRSGLILKNKNPFTEIAYLA